MQKDSRLKRLETGDQQAEKFIQFRLYKVLENVDEKRTLKLYSSQLDRIGSSGNFINSREITKRFKVTVGKYLIIPSTYKEDEESDFMVRVFSELPVGTK